MAHAGADANTIQSSQDLKSTFGFVRRTRPQHGPAMAEERRQPPSSPSPLQLGKKESRGGLRGMFTRARVPDAKPFKIPISEDSESQSLKAPAGSVPGARPARSVSKKVPFYKRPQTAVTVESSAEEKSGSAIGSTKSVRTSNAAQKAPSNSARKIPTRRPKHSAATWDPPPLFQAYPQAIKYATLTASTLSADAVLRISHQKAMNGVDQDADLPLTGVPEGERSIAARTVEKSRSRHRRHVSGSISKAAWTQKIYVLVTSGYLLQYSGSGSFDRLPEKMVQLGKDSVAFASDVIPGKHWVLQISQSMDSNGTPIPDARSLFSRLTFRGADYRRAATSFLLILDSAEDLESWISAVRHEIEALGGKKHVSETGSETGKPAGDGEVEQLKGSLTPRFQVKRDSVLCTHQATHRSNLLDQHCPPTPDDDASFPSTHRLAVDASSVATSVTFQDEQHLECVRDKSNRYSYMSSGQRTIVTSQSSSPACSPTQDASFETQQSLHSPKGVRVRPNAREINDRRRSVQTMQDPAQIVPTTPTSIPQRPHTTYVGAFRNAKNACPLVHNFSKPQASSMTYSARTPQTRRGDTGPLSIVIPGRKIDMSRDPNASAASPGLRTSSPAQHQPVSRSQTPVLMQRRSSFKRSDKDLLSMSAMRVPSDNETAIKSTSITLQQSPLDDTLLRSPGTERMDFTFPPPHSSGQSLPTSPVRGADTRVQGQPNSPLSPRMIALPPTPSSPNVPEPHFPTSGKALEDQSPKSQASKDLLQARRAARRAGRHPSSGSLSAIPNRPFGSPKRTSPPTKHSISTDHAAYTTMMRSSSRKSLLTSTIPVSKSSIRAPNSQSPYASMSTPNSSSARTPIYSPSSVPNSPSSIPTSCRRKVKGGGRGCKSAPAKRSLPVLVTSPPPAPPPTTALPPLPQPPKSADAASDVKSAAILRMSEIRAAHATGMLREQSIRA
ncbi:MAG: hypothetical protein M1818_006210 [Claussenomyces sp. TS43310]|nr:MAG: hypothetical protein M1818_006210 [Claussenomyces sp. TS43310]